MRMIFKKPFFLDFEIPDSNVVCGSIVTEQVRAMDLEARQAKKLDKLDGSTLEKVLT